MRGMRRDKYLKDVVTKRNVDKFRRKCKNPLKTCHLQTFAMEKLEQFLSQVLEDAIRRVGTGRVLVKEKYVLDSLDMYFLKNGSIVSDRDKKRASSAPPP